MRISYSLEKAVPFLLARAGISMGKRFATQLLPFNMSLIEWRVCVSLYELQNSTLGELAEKTSYETSTLSRTINGLTKKKLIARVQSKSDRRSFALKLTPKGRVLTAKSFHWPRSMKIPPLQISAQKKPINSGPCCPRFTKT